MWYTREMDISELARHVFYHTAQPAQILDRIAYYRTAPDEHAPYVHLATAGPFLHIAQNTHTGSSYRLLQQVSPYEPDAPLCVYDPSPRELAAWLRRTLARYRERGSWYRLEPLVADFLETLRTRPAPAVAPAVPELPAYMRTWPEPRTSHLERKQQAEAVAWARGALR